MPRLAITIGAVLLLSLLPAAVAAKEIQGKDTMGRDYWLYVPDEIDPDKTYTLVVGVHGARGIGKGAAGHADWINHHDVIVLGPSYPHNGFQYLHDQTDKQTILLFKQLRQKYKLHDKLFIAGFSGGSQYAHRFAMKYPQLVSGCAAHSGGTWATGDYPRGEAPNPAARGVLFVISCGENDTGKSFGPAPMGRLEWAKKYEQMLKRGGFLYDARWIPDVGHSYSGPARQMTRDCFIASTQRLAEYEAERQAIRKAIGGRKYEAAWQLIRRRINHEDAKNEGILGQVHRMYIDSLSRQISRIDRMAQREVRLASREHEDPETLQAALKELKQRYGGAPRTMKAIERELEKIESAE